MKQYSCSNCAKLYYYNGAKECESCKQDDGERKNHVAIDCQEDFDKIMQICNKEK